MRNKKTIKILNCILMYNNIIYSSGAYMYPLLEIVCKFYATFYCTHSNLFIFILRWLNHISSTIFIFSASSENMSSIKKLFGFWPYLYPYFTSTPTFMFTFFTNIIYVDFLSQSKISYSPPENDHDQLDVIYHLTSIAHWFSESQGDKIQV